MTETKAAPELSDLEILEELRNRLYQAITGNKDQPKVGDLLKVMDMKKKLSVEGRAEKKFWEMINRLRQEELTAPAGKQKGKAGKK